MYTTHILIVDDELTILEMLKLQIADLGIRSDIAQNGNNAIKKMEYNSYGLVLTDIKMPGMSGDKLLEYIRNVMDRSLPVIGMSGTPWLLEQSDFDAVLSKPFLFVELKNVISKYILPGTPNRQH